jgi:hypothetical protein
MKVPRLRKPFKMVVKRNGYIQWDRRSTTLDNALEIMEYEMLRLLGKHLHPCDYADFKKNHTFTYGEWEFTVTERKYKED